MGDLIKYEHTEWKEIKEHWEQLKKLATEPLASAGSRRNYGAALDAWRDWYELLAEPRPRFFSKACVQGFKAGLEARGLAASTVNVQLAAVRKMAAECNDNGLIAPELAAGISRVKGAKNLGVKTGFWLTLPQAQQLLEAPDDRALGGKRDRALLALLVGAGLRRSEALALTVEHVQQREGRWVIVDIKGKGGRIRSIAIASWVKATVDVWLTAAGIQSGCILRPITRGGRVCGDRLSNGHSVWLCLQRYANLIGVPQLAPHDLRRTFAKLANEGDAGLQEIQLALGHASITTTERYLGTRQDLADGPSDHLGLKAPRSLVRQEPVELPAA